MIRPLRVVRWIALCGPAVWLLVSAEAAWSDPCPSSAISPRPFYGGCVPCIPSVGTFGYYPTTWRRWPAEVTPEQAFPQSLGRESIPTPEPEGPIPGPLDEPRPAPDSMPIPDVTLPDGLPPDPPAGQSLFPPEEPLPESPLPPDAERLAEPPLEPTPMPLEPGGLPDSPGEPGTVAPEPSRLPGTETNPLFGPSGEPGFPEPEPITPGEPEPITPGEPAAPAPLDPTGEDPIPGLRSLPPGEGEGAAAAPMPGEMLSAPSLTTARVPMPETPAESQRPTRAERPRVASLQSDPPPAGSADSEDILRAEAKDERVAQRAEWTTGGAPTPSVEQPDGDAPSSLASLPIGEMPPMAPLPPGDEAAPEPDADGDTDPSAGRNLEPVGPADAPALEIPLAEPGPSPEAPSLKPAAYVADPATPLGPNDSRPAALDGFCLYELSANERWVEGDPRWSAEYRGQKYAFSSRQHRDRFLADPARYAPACAGHDPVLVVEAGRRIAGKTDYCVHYDGRLYTFSSAVTLARFQRDPGRYVPGD